MEPVLVAQAIVTSLLIIQSCSNARGVGLARDFLCGLTWAMLNRRSQIPESYLFYIYVCGMVGGCHVQTLPWVQTVHSTVLVATQAADVTMQEALI